MRFLKLWIPVAVAFFIDMSNGISQCQHTFGNLLGSLVENERGYSLTPSPDGQFIYVGGIRKDSALILKVSVTGNIEWTRTFDIVPGRADHIHRLFVDADGMLGVAGTAGTQTNGGTIFAFRYDPDNNKVLWAHEYISTSTNFCLGMIEITPGGNYLLDNNPSSPNVTELVALDKITGEIVPGFSKHYDLGSSESIFDFAYHNGFLYATGRFSDGPSVAEMRNTILKIDPTNGNVSWMKLGHKDANSTARLYGFDLVIYKDEIYSIYLGDPSGTSVDNTLIYMQKTGLNGNLIWLKQFDLPITNDWLDEIIESNGDFVILARNRVSPSNMILIKTNTNGVILWSKEYDFTVNDNATPLGSIQSQLIQVNDAYFFTAYAEGTGLSDMILVKTDLDGNIQDTCSVTKSITIDATTVSSPVFYSKQPTVYDYVPQRKSLSVVAGKTTSILSRSICSTEAFLTSSIEMTLCEGEAFEGYSQTGVYLDTLLSVLGCDSIRTLTLTSIPAVYSSFDVEICLGEVYEGYVDPGEYVDTLISSEGCDSIRTIFLSVVNPEINLQVQICSGESFEGYDETGFYTDTLPGILDECDTIRNISVTELPQITTSIDVEICPGEAYEGYSDPGVYVDTLISVEGCDSFRTIFLTVGLHEMDLQVEICSGGSFEGYDETGFYVDTIQGILSDCDTIRNITLTELTLITTTLNVDICPGEVYEGYVDPGVYVDTLLSGKGCDSIRTIFLSVGLPEISLQMDICSGGSFEGYEVAGIYTDTIPGKSDACDTIRNITLTVLAPITTSIEANICSGEQYYGYTDSGTYTDTLVTMDGVCDSIRTVQLNVIEEEATYTEADICSADAHGHRVPGSYTDTLIASSGCDSIRTIVVAGVSKYIPNIFSPNQDNINDVFEIITFPVTELELTYFVIFDRFGNMVYEKRSWPIRWDGRDNKGEYYNPAVFTYLLTYLCDQKEIIESGNITLLR